MSIKLLTKNGRIGLVAECDVCGERVTADSSHVIWVEMTNADGEQPRHCIVCRGECDGIATHRMKETAKASGTPRPRTGWIPMDVAMMQLEHNLKLNRREAVRRHKQVTDLP